MWICRKKNIPKNKLKPLAHAGGLTLHIDKAYKYAIINIEKELPEKRLAPNDELYEITA